MDAARHWARGGKSDTAALRRDAQELGVPAEQIDLLEGQLGGGEQDFGVWPENWPAAQVFLALETQWVFRPMGGVVGINYGAITPTVLRGLGVSWRDWPDIFERLRVMERAALSELRRAAPVRGA